MIRSSRVAYSPIWIHRSIVMEARTLNSFRSISPACLGTTTIGTVLVSISDIM